MHFDFRDYWWDPSNPKFFLNNIQGKSIIVTIKLQEEIKCDMFHPQCNGTPNNQPIETCPYFECGGNHQINDCTHTRQH